MQLFDYGRATRLMKAAGIDLVLATSKHGVGYLSDYWHPVSDEYYVLWDTTATHKTAVGLPRDEKRGAFLVAGASEATTIQIMDPWIKDRRFWGPGYYIQTWVDPLDPAPDPGDPMKVAADAIREKGLDAGVIAIEERFLGVRYAASLQKHLPRARLVDAEEVLWQLRMIKSPEEQRRLREACVRTGKAWLATVHAAETGMTQPELQKVFMKQCIDHGLEYERAYVIFGPAGLRLVNGSPAAGSIELKEGMYIRIDAQGKFEGYICNLSRVVGHGEMPAALKKAHEIERRLVVDMIPELKPGVRASDIRKKEIRLYDGTGYVPVVPYTGHGVGRVVHEPPYLALNDHTKMAPGMSVTLEPTICYSGRKGDIFVGMEDHFLVTESGAEWMTESAPMGLAV
jgi:Xaa-Pro aminopeptidase